MTGTVMHPPAAYQAEPAETPLPTAPAASPGAEFTGAEFTCSATASGSSVAESPPAAARPARTVFRGRPGFRIPRETAGHPLIRLRCGWLPGGWLPGGAPAGLPRVRLPAGQRLAMPPAEPAQPAVEPQSVIEILPAAEPQAVAEPEPMAEPEPVLDMLPVIEPQPVEQPVVQPQPAVRYQPAGRYQPASFPWPVTEPVIQRRQPTAVHRRRRRVGPPLLAALVCLLTAGLLIAGYLVFRPAGSDTSAVPPPNVSQRPADPAGQLVTWTLQNLPGYTKLLTDAATRTVLVARGYPSGDISALGDSTDHSGAQFLIVTPRVRRIAGQSQSAAAIALHRLLAEAMPVAIFGTGAGRIEVSQLGARRVDLVSGRPARLAAGRALTQDGRLQLDGSTASAVAAGRLDLRAANLLAMLAARQRTELVALEQDRAELLAGSPIRVIDIRSAGDAGDQLLTRTLADMPSELRPAQYTQQSGGYQLVWLPDRAVGASDD